MHVIAKSATASDGVLHGNGLAAAAAARAVPMRGAHLSHPERGGVRAGRARIPDVDRVQDLSRGHVSTGCRNVHSQVFAAGRRELCGRDVLFGDRADDRGRR